MPTPVLPDYVAPFKPVPNVTPFTIRDGITMLKKLDYINKYVSRILIPWINENFADLAGAVETQVNFLITQVNAALAEQTEDVDQKIDDLETYVNEQVQIIITSGIAVSDPVILGVIDDDATDSNQWLNDNFIGNTAGVYNLRSFGDVAGAFTATLNAAIVAVPAGSTIIIPPGTYTNTGNIVNAGKSIHIVATGARILQGSNHTFALFTGAWDAMIAIYAITTADIVNDAGNTRVMSQLNLTDTVTWKRGDVVKVFANDYIPDARTPIADVGARQGEFATVYSVSGTTVTLTGLLRESYTLNPRVQRLQPITVEWEGGTYYGSDESFSAHWVLPVMRFSNLLKPVVRNFRIERSSSLGLDFRSCLSPLIDNYIIDYLANDTGDSLQLGYGVLDIACEGLTWTNSVIRNVRHAFTDDNNRIAADFGEATNYGRSYNARCINVQVFGSSSIGFSPHHGGSGHKFISCTVRQSASNGFGLRGINHEVIDCTAEDCNVSFSLFIEGGGKTYGCRVINGRSINPLFAHVSNTNSLDIGLNPENVYNVEVVGGLFEGGSLMSLVSGGHTRISGVPRWVAPATLPNESAPLVNNGGIMEIADDIELDYRKNTAGEDLHIAIQQGVLPRAFRANRITVRNATLATRMTDPLDYGSGGSGNSMWTLPDVVFDVAPINYWIAQGNDPLSMVAWRTFDKAFSSASYDRSDSSIASAPAPFIDNTPLPVLLLNCSITTATSRILGLLPNGAFKGQLLVVTYTNTFGVATLTIDNDDVVSNVTTGTGADIVLTPGQSITLVWDGTTWRPISA